MSTASELRATRFRWIIFALACATSWMLYLHRYVFALIKPKLKEEYGLGETQLGLLDTGQPQQFVLHDGLAHDSPNR